MKEDACFCAGPSWYFKQVLDIIQQIDLVQFAKFAAHD